MVLRVIRRGLWALFAVCNERGDCPLLDFLYEDSTPTPFGFRPRGPLAKQKIRMLARLAAVAETGPPRNVKICHQIDDEIWQIELGRVRILWFYDEGRVVVLANGFVKSSQKTPEAEKSLARAALKEYRKAKARRRLKILED